MKHIRIDVGTDGIAIITLDNADESVNLVSPAFIEEYTAAVEQVASDAAVTGVIVTSAKKLFMAGADLKFLVNFYDSGRSLKEAFAFSQKATAMHRRMETSGKPFVAAINGAALGGGFELCLACHGRVIVDDPKAVVGLPEVKVGLLPGSGGTQRLVRIAGVERGLDLLLEGTNLTPDKALALGLVDKVVPAAELITAARQWLVEHPDPVRAWDKKGYALPESVGLLNPAAAAFFSFKSAKATTMGRNYPAPIAITSAVFEGVQLTFDGALAIESKYFAKLLTGPVARNIIRTNFINKGAAERLVHRPANVAKSKVSKLGVLGAGMMGAGIASVAAGVGIEVVLLDGTLAQAERGKANIASTLAKDVEKGRRDQASADAILGRVTPTEDYAKLADCDLVVEAVFEDMAVKADVTRKAEAVLPKTATFATNTSTLPITGLAKASVQPDQFIGLHFFSPVERMALVEVIMGKSTSQETLAKGLDFVAQLRKTPVVVNDSRGFYTSRVFQTFIHEGMAMLAEGISPARIENGARQAGMPTGPLALTDELSLELPMKIVEQAVAELSDAFVQPSGTPVLRRMLDEKRIGRKGGAGFYEYPEGGKKHIWEGLSRLYPLAEVQPDIQEIKDRLLYIQALETTRCLEENVLMHAEDGDLGSVLGWGFPTWTGGTLSLIDTVGIEQFVKTCELFARKFGKRFQPSPWLRQRAAAGQAFLTEKTTSAAA
jgi:3-hydroxyacyl-CoA dehydrogenase/enoyl-CoA hydratase/3-hydroxybutyryl-CoA epimerase